ncbi:hypothetical protein HELRODRAFT_188401 [Helobdella robusta]|uniref:SCP domain-containing protein n=1 Tax=Helobdella robusta TaxID=6412 RepID=T1FPY4_HELRO|nr:hypothetical protein HELRODRAFT_188401 [Helobdella robusta]ESO06580.1 hypothetical protein HELRODRAFT_188401 [Helobdella robusta]
MQLKRRPTSTSMLRGSFDLFLFLVAFLHQPVNAEPKTPTEIREFRVQFLKEHNKMRSQALWQAANMRELYYSYELETLAQEKANKCKLNQTTDSSKGFNEFQDKTGKDFPNVKNIIESWLKDEDGSKKQLLMASVSTVGCGYSYCEVHNEYLVACLYDQSAKSLPNGAFSYERGDHASKCPEGYERSGTLCRPLNPVCSKHPDTCRNINPSSCICDDNKSEEVGPTDEPEDYMSFPLSDSALHLHQNIPILLPVMLLLLLLLLQL